MGDRKERKKTCTEEKGREQLSTSEAVHRAVHKDSMNQVRQSG